MSMIKEFREFAVKGNVVDLAVGVVIGAAFVPPADAGGSALGDAGGSAFARSMLSIVATLPKLVILYFSMMSQKREAENFGDTTVEPPA